MLSRLKKVLSQESIKRKAEVAMHRHHICKWIVTAFDSSIEDPRDYLRTEYGGLTLHIKPGHRDEVNRVSVFV